MDLCGPMRIESINGKKYILVIVDDYSRYTWTRFMRSKYEKPEVLKDFLKMIQQNLQAQVITVRNDRGTEFLNKTLQTYFKEEGIDHQTTIAQTPKQNGVVERRNHTLVEAARIMLSASKLPLFFWAESKGYRVYNKRTRLIVESIHINFNDLKEVMASIHNSPRPAPQRQMTLESRKSPTAELIGVDFGRISIRHYEILKSIHLNVLARSTRAKRVATLVSQLG
ncbi:retrovirus-related pol polyprotein from transposon TNT 1-94 [Tanacetum coccineum]